MSSVQSQTSPLALSADRFGHAVWAVALREFRSRYGARTLGLFWAFMEPLAFVLVFTVLLSALRNTQSPLGTHVTPFLTMGIMNYMFFNAVENFVRGGIKANKNLLAFPRIKPIDIYVGRFLMEITSLIVVFTCMFAVYIAFGMVELPDQPLRLLAPLAIATTIGLSVGIINATVIARFRVWENIYPIIQRFNFFTSGVFYVADGMPRDVQWLLKWQPLMHLSEWVRSAWLSGFESRFMNEFGVTAYAACVLLVALLLERVFRKTLLNSL